VKEPSSSGARVSILCWAKGNTITTLSASLLTEVARGRWHPEPKERRSYTGSGWFARDTRKRHGAYESQRTQPMKGSRRWSNAREARCPLQSGKRPGLAATIPRRTLSLRLPASGTRQKTRNSHPTKSSLESPSGIWWEECPEGPDTSGKRSRDRRTKCAGGGRGNGCPFVGGFRSLTLIIHH